MSSVSTDISPSKKRQTVVKQDAVTTPGFYLPKQKPKLLVVDDRAADRRIYKRILSTLDLEIHAAESGQEALKSLIRHNYMLILLDIQMPGMDGIETAQLIRGNAKTENIPIIFLTAYDKDDINMLQGYEIGAIDYILKPINEGILVSKVRTFLRSYLFEKEKEYEKILLELEVKNEKLNLARQEALKMMEDAKRAHVLAQESNAKLEEQTQELMRYTRELEQFAYVATHDLRSPLINLEGFVKLFIKRGLVNEENEYIVSRIENSVTRIKHTLHDLIDVVAYRKNTEVKLESVVFAEVLDTIKHDLELDIESSGARVLANFSRAPKINYCLGYLKSILLNLITNAIKFRSPDRTLQIRIHTEKVPGEDKVMLVVADNGIGMDVANKQRVFELFQRLDPSSPGKGIGLYVTKSQIESLGGSIDFDSRLNEGTTFKIYLAQQYR